MLKIEFNVLMIEEFKYGENKDKPAATLWLSNPSGDPRPIKYSVFGSEYVNKAKAYASTNKAYLTIVPDRELNARLSLL